MPLDPADSTWVGSDAIADLSLTTPTANETAIMDKINAILAALRVSNIIAD